MNNLEDIFTNIGTDDSLTEAERAKMRFVISEYAAFNPRRARAPRAPFAVLSQYVSRAVPAGLAAILMLAITSSSVAFAAEGTLPGDLLYPVKVAVVEPAQALLAATPQEKASLQMTFAARRIDEATALAARGTLAPSTEIALAARFTKSADEARTALTQEGTLNPDHASVASTSFAARLSAYESVLAHIDGLQVASSTNSLQIAVRSQVDALEPPRLERAAATVIMRRAAILAAPARPTAQASSTPTNGDEVTHFGTAANVALKDVTTLVDTSAHSLSSTTSEHARAALTHASELATHGQALLEGGDSSGALTAFKSSLAETVRLDVLTRAAANYKIDAFATTSEDQSSQSTTTQSSNRENVREHGRAVRGAQSSAHEEQ